MLLRSLTIVVLSSGIALAQTSAKPSPQGGTPAKPSSSSTGKSSGAQAPASQKPLPPRPTPPKQEPELPPSTPVVTLTGVCDKPDASGECKTVITKGQLDEIADTLRPNSPPGAEQQLAVAFAQTYVMSKQAEKAGEMQKPGVTAALDFMRRSVLTQLYVRDLQKEAAKVDPAAAEKYYNEHKADYEEAKLSRIFIPKSTPPAASSTAAAKPLDEKAARAEADKMRLRAVAGEDMKKLQEEAYSDLGLKSSPPPSDMGMVRKQNLPEEQTKLFDMKPGEVSQVEEVGGGFVIFKVESKSTVSLDNARPEIERVLQNDNMRDKLQDIGKNIQVTFNPQFFPGGKPPAELFPAPPRPGERPEPERE